MLDTQRRDSKPQVLFINGAAGLGKSSLVEATLKAHAEGYWAVGKCNSPDLAVPYAPWVEILGSLTTQLLAKNSQDLDTLRREILQRIEGHSRLLGKLAPDLQLIVGPLPELPEKPTRLALQKEQRAIVEFLQVFSYPGHPLVLCFDGLQWADNGTRQLLAQLLAQAPDNLLLIFTRRIDTPTAGAPLAIPATLRTTTLNLRPLDVGAVTELISERYHVSPDEALQVAERVHDKTAGNPFFINQILRAMIEDRLFTFDTQAMRWSWCLQAVARQRYADNVAELMIHRLARLPAPQRDVLRVASAAGSRCDERLLHLLLAPPDKPLKALIDAGFLLPGQKGLSFAHDRVMEAAYQLTPACDRAQLHARIAQAMLQVWHNDLQEVVFEIASQLQRASPRGFAADERDVFLQLLREAALRSRDSGACEQSAAHLQVCEQLLLHGASPQSRATHAFAVACMAAECDLQLSRMAAARSDSWSAFSGHARRWTGRGYASCRRACTPCAATTRPPSPPPSPASSFWASAWLAVSPHSRWRPAMRR